QSEIDYIADNLDIEVRTTDNLENDGQKHGVNLLLHNTGNRTIKGRDWEIYFYSFFMVEPEMLEQGLSFIDRDYMIKLSHVSGTLYKLEPLPGFRPIKPGQDRDIEFNVKYWSASASDYLPNWYVTAKNHTPRVIRSTTTKFPEAKKHIVRESINPHFVGEFGSASQWKRYRDDEMNPFTPQDRYIRYKRDEESSIPRSIVPTPKSVVQSTFASNFLNSGKWNIVADPQLDDEASLLKRRLGIKNIDPPPYNKKSQEIQLILDPDLPVNEEGYHLKTFPLRQIIAIKGRTPAGVYYGIETLGAFIDQNGPDLKIRGLDIKDDPRFHYRGLHIDLARNFLPRNELKRVIDHMGMYKLNKLHLSLSNDEGWRIEIPDIPELTQIGSQRCHDLEEKECLLPQLGSGPDQNSTKTGSGFLTIEDYKFLVRYAAEHHIEIIPEINSPGHAYAAIKSLEERHKKAIDKKTNPLYRLKDPEDLSEYLSVQNYRNNVMNPCMESTYIFIQKVIQTLKDAHESVGVPLETYHFGGDDVPKDVWLNSTACNHGNKYKDWRSHFNRRIAAKTEQLGVKLAGYDDGFVDRDGAPYLRPKTSKHAAIAQFYNSIPDFGKVNRAHDLANADYKVVLSPATHLYFDHPYEPDPEERGLYWATRYSDTKKMFGFMPDNLYINFLTKRSGERISMRDLCGIDMKNCPKLIKPENVIGLEGQLWGELVTSREQLDYMLFPRLLALAERAWHKAPWEDIADTSVREREMNRDWNKFANNVGTHDLARLYDNGIQYRVSPPGAKVEDGRILTSTEFPQETVEVSTNGGKRWKPVPIEWSLGGASNEILLRTRALDKRTSRAVEFDPRGEVFIPNQKDVDNIARSLYVTYTVLNNLVDTNNSFLLRLTFENVGNLTVTYGNWSIYFYSIRLLQPQHFPYENGYLLHDCGLWLHHVAGSLYRLQPDFDKFIMAKGQKRSCLVRGKYWQVARTDIMPKWYIAADGMMPRIIENTKGDDLDFVQPFNAPNRWKRYPNDQFNPYSPMTRYRVNDDVIDYGGKIKPVIPTPRLLRRLDMSIIITPQDWAVLESADFPQESKLLADTFNLPLVSKDPNDGRKLIRFTKTKPTNQQLMDTDPGILRDSYVISMTNEIYIEANDGPGAFYAVMTLESLGEKTENGTIVPVMVIMDSPRYSYRGLHLDVARNFKRKEEVMKLLDLMSRYKLNKFHFHLSDDEGWRLQIPELPELTKVGAHRCHDPEETKCTLSQLGSGPFDTYPGSGYYTVKDYRDILKYAADRHIEVIPEVNTPGHSHAAITAMESRYHRFMKNINEYEADRFLLSEIDDNSTFVTRQSFSHNVINPCLESTYSFIYHVIKNMKKMHSDIQPLRVYHFGGPGGDVFDTTVWNASKICQRFIKEDPSNMKITDLPLYFLQRIGEIARAEDLQIGLWEDALMAGGKPFQKNMLPMDPGEIHAYAWKNVWDRGEADNAHKLANADYKVILAHATHLFLDHPHEPDPEERGYYWATRFIDTRKVFGYTPDHIIWNADLTSTGVPITYDEVCPSPGCEELNKTQNIAGIQGNLWSETIRNEDDLDSMSSPRVLALAERAWHHSEWEDEPDILKRHRSRDQEWYQFANTLGYKELLKLDQMGYKYHIPLPGAM
ncbi:hypothetical protein FSP39_005676, partial [Pinctada imbricata]